MASIEGSNFQSLAFCVAVTSAMNLANEVSPSPMQAPALHGLVERRRLAVILNFDFLATSGCFAGGGQRQRAYGRDSARGKRDRYTPSPRNGSIAAARTGGQLLS